MTNEISNSGISISARALHVLKTQLSVKLLVGTTVAAFLSPLFLGFDYKPLSLNTLSLYLFDVLNIIAYFLLLRDSRKAGIKPAPFYLLILLQFCYFISRSIGVFAFIFKLKLMDFSWMISVSQFFVHSLPFIIAALLILSGNKYLKTGGVIMVLKTLAIIASMSLISLLQERLLGSDLQGPVVDLNLISNALGTLSSIIISPLLILFSLSIGLGVYQSVSTNK